MQKTVIEAKGKNLQYWKDLWRYRELTLNFAKRDFTVRYKQTAIGLGWSIINPIINMLIMTFIFGDLAGFDNDTSINYYIVTYAGIIPWTLFSRTVQQVSTTFITNADLMKKVYFPRMAAPIASSVTALFDTMISFVILLVMMPIFGYTPPVRMLLAPLFLIPVMVLAIFLGMILASFTVKQRDLIQIVPLLLQVGQYASPVAFTLAAMKGKVSQLVYYVFMANPASGILTLFKWSILEDPSGAFALDKWSLIISGVWIVVLVPLAIARFRKVERDFVDYV